MATLLELGNLLDDASLRVKLKGALLVAAQTVVANGSATPAQKEWARECFSDPTQFLAQAWAACIAANAAATPATILAAADSAIQNAVTAALPVLTG